MRPLLALLLLPLLIAGCGAPEPEAPVLRFSAIPDEDVTGFVQKFRPVAAYLSERLGVPVEYQHSESYAASVETVDTAKAACEEGCVKPCCAEHAYTYSVSGMTCGACVAKVEGAIQAMENDKVAGTWVDLDSGTAVVTSTEEIDDAAIAAAITKSGFPAEIAVEKDKAEKQAEGDEAAATM